VDADAVVTAEEVSQPDDEEPGAPGVFVVLHGLLVSYEARGPNQKERAKAAQGSFFRQDTSQV
jgi:hypothetical protein